jgi:hypothetical protein
MDALASLGVFLAGVAPLLFPLSQESISDVRLVTEPLRRLGKITEHGSLNTLSTLSCESVASGERTPEKFKASFFVNHRLQTASRSHQRYSSYSFGSWTSIDHRSPLNIPVPGDVLAEPDRSRPTYTKELVTSLLLFPYLAT